MKKIKQFKIIHKVLVGANKIAKAKQDAIQILYSTLYISFFFFTLLFCDGM